MTSSLGDPEPAGGAWRTQAADLLQAHETSLADMAIVGLPTIAADTAEVTPLGVSLSRLLVEAVRTGRGAARSGDVIGLAAVVDRLGLEPTALFTAVYQLTIAAVDQLERDPALGAASGDWPQVANSVRRAAFDVLAAWTARALELPAAPSMTDSLTSLHTRTVFDTVFFKECQRAERFEHWVSILLIAVRDLPEINRIRGYGVGDQVLERMGILIRRYFRQHDWVARYRDEAVAVLLPETGPDDALTLAGLMRTMIEERLAVDDEHQRPVAASVAIASARPLRGHPVDPERILEELDAALERTAAGDGSTIESVEIHPVTEPIEEPSVEP
jgi:diguanylate cyclase (GGDEF)-like protein